MKLYLSAKTKTGYTPDWIQIEYTNDKNQMVALTMDIQGEIEYNPETLDVRVKGELLPWVYRTENDEIDLSDLSNRDTEKYEELFNKYITKASYITIGLYPVTDDENDYDKENSNAFKTSEGEYHYIEDEKQKRSTFTFDGEIND